MSYFATFLFLLGSSIDGLAYALLKVFHAYFVVLACCHAFLREL